MSWEVPPGKNNDDDRGDDENDDHNAAVNAGAGKKNRKKGVTSVQNDLKTTQNSQKQFKNDSKPEFERAIQLMSQDGNIDAKKEMS